MLLKSDELCHARRIEKRSINAVLTISLDIDGIKLLSKTSRGG